MGLLALRRATNGVLSLSNPWLTPPPRRTARLRVPDILPALINAVRAFLTKRLDVHWGRVYS